LLLAAPLVTLIGYLDGPILLQRRKAGGVVVLLFSLGFGPALLAEVDRDLDRSAARPFTAQVLSKRVSHHRRPDSHYLTLAPCGDRREPEEILVSPDLYNALAQGSRACIQWRPGALDTPWYDIKPCDAATTH